MYNLSLIRETLIEERQRINGPEDAANFFRPLLGNQDQETVLLACLNAQNHVLAVRTISLGTVNSSLLHPREVFRAALQYNSVSIILAHNHPSGNPMPSKDDYDIQARLVRAGEIIGINVLDHVIIGEGLSYRSITSLTVCNSLINNQGGETCGGI